MRNLFGIRSLLFSVLLLAMSAASFGQIGISITLAPPVLPVYEQPICPEDGYLWTPGYWAYGDDGYYWVSGDWIQPPEVGYLWTPGYWGWGGNAYAFHEGYWGETVGFYGGINYGYGYGGNGYEGGRWDNGRFAYNTSVNRVNTTIIHNTYNTRVVESNTRVSFNGGSGGIEARATAQQEAAGRQRHVAPVAAQTAHVQEARSNPELRASANHGNPPANAVAKSETAARPEAANARAATPNRASEKEAVAPSNVKPEQQPAAARTQNSHASEIAPHTASAPNTGNAKTDQKYQKQQDTMVAKQNQDHQKLAQQQEKQHQQLNTSNANDARKQQVEQQHQQQTQQLEQKHAAQTQKVQSQQQPAKAPQSKPAEAHPQNEKPH
ncbi:MAG TPA: hypothetical protein VKF79_10135 [Candidatus Acidoferrum sp.]|nr:hypothetical protein [Candidatus Acidoferrum sp.]